MPSLIQDKIHAPFKSFVMEQIRHKLIAFEGKAKVSRIKAVMKWWKCISMVMAKTASRNVAFKSDKLMDALFREGQSGPQTPQTVFDADFEGLTSNAELYIFNQEEVRIGSAYLGYVLDMQRIWCKVITANIIIRTDQYFYLIVLEVRSRLVFY